MAGSSGYLARTTTSTTGNNNYVLDTANLTTAYRTIEQAVADGSISDGNIVRYVCRDPTVTGDAAFEAGEGVYTHATKTVARAAVNVLDSPTGPGNLHTWPGSGTRDFYIVDRTANLDRGNVFCDGAGSTATATTTANMLVVDSDTQQGISVLTPDASFGRLHFGSPTNNVGSLVRWKHSTNTMDVGTNNAGGIVNIRTGAFTTAVTIDASQNVGVGTSSPASNLHIHNGAGAGSVTDSGNIIIESDGATELQLQCTDLQTAAVVFSSPSDATAAKVEYRAANTRMDIDSPGDIIFRSGGTAVMNMAAPTSDTPLLLIRAGAAGEDCKLKLRSGNAGETILSFGDTDADDKGSVAYDHNTDDMTIDATGDVIVDTDLVVRQSGGVAGTDEVLIKHDGSNTTIRSESGAILLVAGGISGEQFNIRADGSLRLPQLSSDPGSPSDGCIWYVAGVTNKFRGRANGVTVDLH